MESANQEEDQPILQPSSASTTAKTSSDDTRRRTRSMLEKLRLRSKTTVERDHSKSVDFGRVAQGELLGLSISLRIPFTRTGAGRNGAMKVMYIIRCTMAPPEHAPSTTPVKMWEVAKRYSEFVRLDKSIKDELLKSHASLEGAYGLALLPPRHLLTSDFDENVISERKQGFLTYLQSALTASFFFEVIQPLLATFLECPGAPKSTRLHRQDDSMEGEDDGYNSTAVLTQTVLGQAQHGFLHKHSGPNHVFKPFKLVFCVLNFEEGLFRVYKPSHPVLLGEYKIKGIYGKATPLEPKQFGVPSNGFGFTVWTTAREMIFYADSSDDRAKWIQSFRALLSSVMPPAIAAMPIRSPRPPTNPVDLEVTDLSLGSLVYQQEARRLSHLGSDATGRPPSDAGLSSPGRRHRTSSAIEPDPKSNSGSGFTKPSRGNSLLESVHESHALSDNTIGGTLSGSSQHDPHGSSLQAHTREALAASSRRRSRSRTSSDVGGGGGGVSSSEIALGSATAAGSSLPRSPTRAMAAKLAIGGEQTREGSVERVQSISPVNTNERSLSNPSPTKGVSDAVSLETFKAASKNPQYRQPRHSSLTIDPNMPSDRPRFPSNISVYSADSPQARRLRDDSIRPPSQDPDEINTPARSFRGLISPKESSSYRKLPPPRFPSNLRIASSGGSSAASPRRQKSGKARPHPFRLFMSSSTAPSRATLDVLDDDSVDLFARALIRLKTDALPTRNPYVLMGLLSTPDPWKGRALGLMSAHQFSACMENVYFDTHSLRKSASFRPRQSDIIVTSVARAGATPILFALDSLRNGELSNLEDLPSRAPWIEGKDTSLDGGTKTKMVVTPVGTAKTVRVLKTTMPLRYCLGIAGGNVLSPLSPRVVVVLRDPLDIKLSWYRHCRRIYKKCNRKGRPFDDKFALEDFAQVPIPSCNPTFSAAMSPNETYEVYIREVLQVYEGGKWTGHLHIVFYEELIADCENTIRKLANFINPTADEKLIRQIVDAIQDSPDFPGSRNERNGKIRVGSTGQGFNHFDRYDVEMIDLDWDKIVRAHFPQYDQYSTIYETILDQPYPHPRVLPFEEDLAKARRKSSGLNPMALLQTGNRRSLIKDFKVSKLVHKRQPAGANEPFYTNSGPEGRVHKKRLDPDDTDAED